MSIPINGPAWKHPKENLAANRAGLTLKEENDFAFLCNQSSGIDSFSFANNPSQLSKVHTHPDQVNYGDLISQRIDSSCLSFGFLPDSLSQTNYTLKTHFICQNRRTCAAINQAQLSMHIVHGLNQSKISTISKNDIFKANTVTRLAFAVRNLTFLTLTSDPANDGLTAG